MATKTIRILKGPSAFDLINATAHISDPSNVPDLPITLEHAGYPRFDGKSLVLNITRVIDNLGRKGINFEGRVNFKGEPSRMVKGVLNFTSGVRGSIEVETD